jgi:hypothetical protein
MMRAPALSAAVAVLAAAALSIAPVSVAGAQDASTVHASPRDAARLLFVAGDVRRLSRTPSGTLDIVLEKVLQEEYRNDASLAPADAKSDIETLSRQLDKPATSPATLVVLPGNQRILAILAALWQSDPAPRVQRALASVADQALAESSASARTLGREFNDAADTVSTLLYGGFSPTATLGASSDLAASNPSFGRARDALWAAASHESVFDGSAALVAGNPALQNDATRALTQGLAPDGSLTAKVSDVEALVRDGLQAVGAQSTQAIGDHRNVARECPGVDCQAYRDQASADGAAGRAAISAQQAAVSAAGGLLEILDARYGAAVQAEAQAAAQVANGVNSYFAATDYNQYIHAAVDVAGLAASLAVAEVDPAAAINGVVNLVHDVVNIGVPRPDANTVILQGLQGVSQQLSAFAQETAAQFGIVDARLETLSRQVGTLAGQLSAQLAEARTQLTGLGNALSDLQGSVDRLHSEIQQLFADGARNALRTLVTQSVGYAQINNGRRLSAEQFAPAAAALFDNATATSLSQTVLTSPLGFDAPAAAAITELDPSVNFFALFPASVTDAPSTVTWPAPLTVPCKTGRCLPSPDYWAVASRAFAQLLLENRDYVTPAYLTQLDTAIAAGRSLDAATRRISANDVGANGTGSRLFNAALGYYDSWVGTDGDRPADGAPALLQALRAERERYLATQRPPGIESGGGPWIDPWAGTQQSLGKVDLLGVQWLQNPASIYPVGGFTIPDLRPVPALVSRLPLTVQNAIRLGIGQIRVSWRAIWSAPPPQPGNPGTLDVSMYFRYYVPPSATRPAINDDLGWVEVLRPFTPNCAGVGDLSDAERTFVASWSAKPGCRNFADEFRAATGSGPNAGGVYSHDDSGFAHAVADLTPLVDARLRELQTDSLKALLVDGSTLSHGDGTRATDVQAAANRVQGAEALIRGYVALGLPQALASDDNLRGLVAGESGDALLHPYFDDRRAVLADTVPDQLANLIKFELAHGVQQSDPFEALRIQFRRHSGALANAIGTFVKTGRAYGQDAADGGRLDEGSPLVASTIDRLELSRAVLADRLAHPPAAGGGDTPAPPAGGGAPAPAPQPAPGANPVAPAPPLRAAAARARVIRAPAFKRRAIAFTVGCVSGACRLTTTVTSGRTTVGRVPALTLAAGGRRTVTVRLNAAGRRLLARRARLAVTVTITLDGAARPLARTRLTLR